MVHGAEAKMKASGGSSAEAVKVVVRCRPMDEQETANGHKRLTNSNSLFLRSTEIYFN